MKRRRLAAFLLGVLPGLGLAQSAGQWRDATQAWNSLCRYCHEAPIGPVLFGSNLPQAYISLAVRSGHNAMPAFAVTQLSDKELAALSHWITQQSAPVPRP